MDIVSTVKEKLKNMRTLKKYTIIGGIISLVSIIIIKLFNYNFNKFILTLGSIWIFYLIIVLSILTSEHSNYYLV